MKGCFDWDATIPVRVEYTGTHTNLAVDVAVDGVLSPYEAVSLVENLRVLIAARIGRAGKQDETEFRFHLFRPDAEAESATHAWKLSEPEWRALLQDTNAFRATNLMELERFFWFVVAQGEGHIFDELTARARGGARAAQSLILNDKLGMVGDEFLTLCASYAQSVSGPQAEEFCDTLWHYLHKKAQRRAVAIMTHAEK